MDKKEIINKLYIDPIESVHQNKIKPKNFHTKELSKEEESTDISNTVPSIRPNTVMGNVILQNWETKKNIPSDIGELIHFPVMFDKAKFIMNRTVGGKYKLPQIKKKQFDFSKTQIKEKGERLFMPSTTQINTTATNYFPSETILNQDDDNKDEVNEEITNIENENEEIEQKNQNITSKKKELINFSTFSKHLYLKDKDFLYAKRVGGPVDFVLCTYQDINPKAKKLGFGMIAKGKKLLPSLNRKKPIEYITISKNTVMHYQRGNPVVYSVQEWIDNYNKFQQLMSLSLFKNFKNAKLFDLWRRFYRKSRREYYTEKLKKRFFLIDEHLRTGIFDVRRIITEMEVTNIFSLGQSSSLLLNKFKDAHATNLTIVDQKIESFRQRIKTMISNACNSSYIAFKEEKKITLDDNVTTDANNNNNNKKVKNKNNEGANIQNFIKDAIPYAQDATRKTHYKKLLRYIRVMDYLFNEAKFKVIEYSLNLLDVKFKRLYDCYVNKWVDPPIIITKILCMSGNIYYNPSINLMSEAIFEDFIQETIYCVIYKKNYIDPQEFPRYMTCFEEVFDMSVDQNTNLNNRIKETKIIIDKFTSIRDNFEKCHEALDEYVNVLKPIYQTYLAYEKINFKELEKTSTPDELKNLLESFKEKDKVIKALRPVKHIGIFEFQIDDLLELISNAPKNWIEKIKIVIPNVLVFKVNELIDKLNVYHKNLGNPVTDVETFIKLKKAVEECNAGKAKTEEQSNDIVDLQQILENHKEIKLQDYDAKRVIELKDINVKYERKLDASSYFIDNNIQKYRLDLKVEIANFDNQIKGMISELNNETLNKYNEDTFNAIDFLEENSLKIQKCVQSKEKYQQEEDDLEIDETQKSNFQNLDNLVYDQQLKVDIWTSVREFQFKKSEWEKQQILSIKIDKMKELLEKWENLCEVALVDLDIPGVPIEFKKRIEVFKSLVPILTACQNQNIQNDNLLNQLLFDLLRVEMKLDDPLFTCDKLMNIPDIFDRVDEFEELNFRANEEKRLKDLLKSISDNFYPRKIPIKMSYKKGDFDEEFEFVEKNIMIINRIYLEKYVNIIFKDLEKVNFDFRRYQNLLFEYSKFQDYVIRSSGIMESQEFAKEMPTEYKKLLSENLKRNLMKNFKDFPNVQRFLEHAYDKSLNLINTIILNFEQNYKAIAIFLDKKRKDNPRYYLLSNDDLVELYEETPDIKTKIILKIFTYLKEINIGSETDETMSILTTDNESIVIKYTKSTKTIKDVIDVMDTWLVKRLKDNFKGFKKEYEASFKAKSIKKPKEVIKEMILNPDNLGQGIFNSMYYLMIDSLEKCLFNAEEAFDKLFDLYNEIKDERIIDCIDMIKNPKIPFIKKRIIINIISLYNYTKSIIEILIREDVTSNSDYYFYKLINPKLENDSYILHFLNFTLEYGYEYVGIQNNFLMLPEAEKTYLVLANSMILKRPFQLYGVKETGRNETIRNFSNLCGKRINYISSNENYSVQAFNNVLLGNLKNGCWICIDRTENMKFELLEVLAVRILEVYRIFRECGEDDIYAENGEKYQMKVKQMNIFIYRYLPSVNVFNKNDIPANIKNYFRQIAIPFFDMKFYIYNMLNNLAIENCKEMTNKIYYTINYANSIISFTKKTNIQVYVIRMLNVGLLKKIGEINNENLNENIRNILKETYSLWMNSKELEEFRKFENEVFNMKEYEKDINPVIESEDPEITKIIQEQLTEYKFSNNLYEQKITYIMNSLEKNHSFVLCGPPLSGKTQMMVLLTQISKKLNELNSEKYSKIFSVKLYPKTKTPTDFFFTNKADKAYKFNNNFFYNMYQLFNSDKQDILIKLNEYYSQCLKMRKKNTSNESLFKLIFDKKEEDEIDNNDDRDDEEEEMVYRRNRDESNVLKDDVIKVLVFDGNIDSNWIEYINSIYGDSNIFTCSDGNTLNLNNNFKLFFEVDNLKNGTPVFLTRQYIIQCDYNSFSWDNILYSWIESNEKITANSDLKNYVRGLFENFFPKIYDFILNNRYKNINFGENYVMKTLINIFDSILPLFNFEDKKIGRKNFHVIPKIELIKKSTLSIFIFSCGWTMNFLSNFIIRTKIEKLIGDIFKADDLKGPIFDYYIDEKTNDFELWSNLLKDEIYQSEFGEKGKTFYYNRIFIHTLETISYYWLCEKFINMNIPFFLNGKTNSGKSFLLNSLLDKMSYNDLSIKKIKFSLSYASTPEQIENYLYSNLDILKRDSYGDKYGKTVVLYIDDVNLNLKKDSSGSNYVFEYLRQLAENNYIYDQKMNYFVYLDNFNICASGNINSYPHNEQFDRLVSKYVFVTQVQSEDFYLPILKPTLEFHLRQYIPNTSGITATQYIQTLIKLNSLLCENIINEPKKTHYAFSIRDMIKVVQAFHLFQPKSISEFTEYLKKLFFYETSLIYESRMNKQEDIEIFREKLCEAYSSVFKQDKVTPNDIFNNWNNEDSYLYCNDYDNFNGDNEDLNKDHIFSNKKTLVDFIKNRISRFYREKDIKNTNLIAFDQSNIDNIIKISRFLENPNPNLILIGKKNCGKNLLFRFSAFISGIDIIDVNASYNNSTPEKFIQNVINPFLLNATIRNKKTILFISSEITSEYIFEIINKLLDIKEIINNFIFLTKEDLGRISEDDIIPRLENNISICIDLIPKTNEYINLYQNYPSITKKSQVIYIHNWRENDYKLYVNQSIEGIEIENNKDKFPEIFYNTYLYTKNLYEEYSKKIGMKILINQKHYSSVCNFYSQKYKSYQEILLNRQKRYFDSIEMINKSKVLIEDLSKQIEEVVPKKAEIDKKTEDKRKEIAQQQKDKNTWRNKKTDEEKTLTLLDGQRKEKQGQYEKIIQPFTDGMQKQLNQVNKIVPADLTEIKNTWDGLTFGKFVLTKIYELCGETNLEWDAIKKNLDIKIIKNFTSINPILNQKKLIDTTREITNHPDFTTGEKYQKPFKACGTFCDYFNALKKYFDERDNQKELLDNIEKIKNDIDEHKKIIKQCSTNLVNIATEIEKFEKDLINFDNEKFNVNSHMNKLEGMKHCFEELITSSNEKIEIWKKKKETVDILLNNFDFYLYVISSYLYYAGPLNKNFRLKLKMFLYSQASQLGIEDINTFPFYKIFLELLDYINKDHEFCSSISQYNEFLSDNFTIMYILQNKIPYIIDYNRIAIDCISSFLEFTNPKSIVSTNYNDINGVGEMFEKIESSLKGGVILFIDNCEGNIYHILDNLIIDNSTYNSEKGRFCYEIKDKKMEKNNKFKLYLVKSRTNSIINDKVFTDCVVVNFNCPSDYIEKKILGYLVDEQDPITYQQIKKLRINISKDEFKLVINENRLINFAYQFDFTGHLEKLDNNQTQLDKYKVEITTHSTLQQKIKNDKLRLTYDLSELERYKLIIKNSCKIYKWISHFFNYDNIYMFTLEYYSNLIKEFYKNKFGIYKDKVKKRKNKNFILPDEEEEQEHKSEGEESNEEEDEEDENSEEAKEEKKIEENEEDVPTYEEEDLIEFVVYLYNKNTSLFLPNQKKNILLILLFFCLKEKEEIPPSYKRIIMLINDVFFNKNRDFEKYNEKSPIKGINDHQWNSLKEINERGNYIFSILINNMETNVSKWEEFILKDIPIFKIFDEDVESSMNTFIRFIFFSIIKPYMSDALITYSINSILESNPDKKIALDNNICNQLNEPFFEDFTVTKKPILYVENENEQLILNKEIRDYLLPTLAQIRKVSENNQNNKEIDIETLSYREIIPNKIELSNAELDFIHNSMKNGGVIVIKNVHLVKDSIMKLFEEFNDPNTVLNEHFKLIFTENHNYPLPTFFYENCRIVNRDLNVITEIKDYIIDLIELTSYDIYNNLMNSQNQNSSAYYIKKLYIYFTIVHAVLVQYSCLKTTIFRIPIEYKRKDYFNLLKFLIGLINSFSEDKQKELVNNDNIYGFTYESIIKLFIDMFIDTRLLYPEDVIRINQIVNTFFDNDNFLNKNYLFSFEDFIIENIKPEDIPEEELEKMKSDDNNNTNNNPNNQQKGKDISNTNTNQIIIPKSVLIKKFKNIPNEQFNSLIFGMSSNLLKDNSQNTLKSFYKSISIGLIGDTLDKINISKLNTKNMVYSINEIKTNIPDPLSITEANPALFKINKFDEFFNPFDESLQTEIENYNNYLSLISNDIDTVNKIFRCEMFLTDEYFEIMRSLSKKEIPDKWRLHKSKRKLLIADWKIMVKEIFNEINEWIKNAFLKVYDLSHFSDYKLFLNKIPLYFNKKLPENSATPDILKLKFFFTKFKQNSDLTDEEIGKYKNANDNKEMIFIKGIKLNGFVEEKEEEGFVYKQNDYFDDGELCPIIGVTYTLLSFKDDEDKKNDENEEEDDDEEKND